MGYKSLKFPDNSKFLVTGGAGFIGSNLCEAILRLGYKVRCLDDLSTGKQANVDMFLDNPDYEFIKGDIKDLNTCMEACKGVDYVMSCADLEYTDAFGLLQNNAYGGMPIQLGYCNGHNTKLNCLEYHRDSELNIGSRDFILLLAKEDDIVDGKLDTSKVKAFYAKAGQVVEVYATTGALLYSSQEPCCKASTALPAGTYIVRAKTASAITSAVVIIK